MRVIAIEDCFYDNNYIRQGEHFEYTGELVTTKEGKKILPAGMARAEPEEEAPVITPKAKTKSKTKSKASAKNDDPFSGF